MKFGRHKKEKQGNFTELYRLFHQMWISPVGFHRSIHYTKWLHLFLFHLSRRSCKEVHVSLSSSRSSLPVHYVAMDTDKVVLDMVGLPFSADANEYRDDGKNEKEDYG